MLVDTSREPSWLETALANRKQAVSIVKRMEAVLQEGIIPRVD